VTVHHYITETLYLYTCIHLYIYIYFKRKYIITYGIICIVGPHVYLFGGVSFHCTVNRRLDYIAKMCMYYVLYIKILDNFKESQI